MKLTIQFLLSFILFVTISNVHYGQDMAAQMDSLLEAQYKEGAPGASALVAKDGKVIYKKAFGNANLELNVPMNTEHVFEIGSITKQFTSVGIMMLLEDGKLSLEDEITKYIEDYPTQGQKITIHHLLNHTSGVKSYTDMSSFIAMARTDMKPLELIDVFKNEKMDFNPGEDWHYSNSGYILLGYIIEAASGESYERFIEGRIFKKLGMNNSYYGSKSQVIPNRASGYEPSGSGYNNAKYLSMTLPYAAGSLMSTVEDLLKWNQAIHNNELITEASKKMAFTNTTLNNGEATNYGYGWMPNIIQGVPSIEHGGGIFGYTTMGVYIPSENIYVAVLTNTNGLDPSEVAVKMAAVALGKPYSDIPKIDLSAEQLEKWVGTYEFDGEVLRFVTSKDGKLYSQREGSTIQELHALSPSKFRFEGSMIEYEFSMENGRKKTRFMNRIDESIGVESQKKPASEREAMSLEGVNLEELVGGYELQPNFVIDITVKDAQIFLQATGQPKFEMFGEKEDAFFLKVVPAKIDFVRDESGKIESLILHQGGRDLPGKKIN